LSLFCFAFASAQVKENMSTNLRIKKITTKELVILDANSIVPNSFTIQDIDSSFYSINFIQSTIYFKKPIAADSVLVEYRVFNFSFSKPYQAINYDSIKYNFIAKDKYKPYLFNTQTIPETYSSSSFGKINYSGSFGRNISFGNNQDAVFNSQLNLQLNGYVGDSIEFAATITDNNIPIQPEGTTQRINEFDRILLQFTKKNVQLSLGDIDLRQSKNYFLNFYKRLQGISLMVNKKEDNQFNITGAIARGKFTRYVFNGQEGNQGPYRLQGANGETFFIVLANTERVFIDGELLKRGEDLDYIINYNTGEVLFTPKRMITKDKRIQIEFEYAERSYLNSMLYISNETNLSKRLKINFAAYNNSDAKNSPINQQLDPNQKQFLANLGNNFQQAFYPFAAIDSFSTTKILYKKQPNPTNNNDSIYVYSNNKDSAKYSLSFLEVGANKGNYIPLFNAVNGKVYEWIQPINGVPQGNFEPAQFLVTPKQQQIFTAGISYNINKFTTAKTDLAYSNFDVNTLSSLNKNNNKGYALKSILHNEKILIKNLSLQTTLQYEYVHQNFRPVERLRTVEFSRDWGLPILPNQATEQLPKISFTLIDKQNNSLQFTSEAYLRSDGFNGFRQSIQHEHTLNNWQVKNSFALSNNTTPQQKGFFIKPIIDLSKTFTKLNSIGFNATYSIEHNEQKNKLTDSLSAISFAFETITAAIKSNSAKPNKWSISYFTRSDKLPIGKELKQVDRSHNYTLALDFLENQNRLLRSNITYRTLQVYEQNITSLKPDNSLLSRTEYSFNEWNGFVNGYLLYELGAGQEQRRDFSYIEVPAGRGQYTWNDYNNDGIAQLNEFEIAPFIDQAKYIRVFTPTNQFVKANYNTFNYNITLQPRAITNHLKNEKVKIFVNRFGFISSLQTSNKIVSSGNFNLNPFSKNINDTALVSSTNNFTHTLIFNRASAVWGFDITHINNASKSLLTYGLETRSLAEWIMKTRFNFLQRFSFETIARANKNILTTPQFSNRNFEVDGLNVEPKLIYTYQTNYRVQLSYLHNFKKNAKALGGEESLNQSFSLETKFNSANSSSVNARFTYSNINFKGVNNTTTSFVMLEGLLPGKNYLWNIDFTKRLKNNFEVSFSYEGRKVGEGRLINIGRASIRAIL
jgi:hypothetical protein